MSSKYIFPAIISGTIVFHNGEAPQQLLAEAGYRGVESPLGPHPETPEPENAIRTPVVSQVTTGSIVSTGTGTSSGMVWMT